MEFHFDVNNAMHTVQVLKINHTLTAIGHENNDDLKNTISLIIDEMGKMSAIAQNLQTAITSANNLKNSDQVLYVMTEHYTPKHFAVVGILNMGLKKIHFSNQMNSQPGEPIIVYCLSDFYIYESKQRKGYGKYLLDYMLQDLNLKVSNLAIENPSNKFLQFMRKHYQLSKLIYQEHNFAVFEEFFNKSRFIYLLPIYAIINHLKINSFYYEFIAIENIQDNNEDGASTYSQLSTFGRHGAHKHHDTMGEIVHGVNDSANVKLKNNHAIDSDEKQINEVKPHSENENVFQTNMDNKFVKRDLKFHHSSIW